MGMSFSYTFVSVKHLRKVALCSKKMNFYRQKNTNFGNLHKKCIIMKKKGKKVKK